MNETNTEINEELEFLNFFFQNADFGPADSEVREMLEKEYTQKTGKPVPPRYSSAEED